MVDVMVCGLDVLTVLAGWDRAASKETKGYQRTDRAGNMKKRQKTARQIPEAGQEDSGATKLGCVGGSSITYFDAKRAAQMCGPLRGLSQF